MRFQNLGHTTLAAALCLLPFLFTGSSLSQGLGPSAAPGADAAPIPFVAPEAVTPTFPADSLFVPIPNNWMVYNPANGLFYLSVPSSAGAPYGNSVVSVDPVTGQLGTPIYVGSEPGLMDITADGHYLWVALNASSQVRQVDLEKNVAGFEFHIGGNANPLPWTQVFALAALPGSPNSVVVSTGYLAPSGLEPLDLAIYDNGVPRTADNNGYIQAGAGAIQINPALSEIYAAGDYYNVFTYNAGGVQPKLFYQGNPTGVLGYANEMQYYNGLLYTDGGLFHAETGHPAGGFKLNSTTTVSGPTFVDSAAAKVFVLDYTSPNTGLPQNQIYAFELSTGALASQSSITVSIPILPGGEDIPPTTLRRWGADGLAYRNATGFFSLRSNVVQNLAKVDADLAVALATSGSLRTGSTTTYTATVTNAGPSTATAVSLTATPYYTAQLHSAKPSAGSCFDTLVPGNYQGAVCDLGSLSVGSKATVTFVVEPTTPASNTFSVSVNASETDPKTANNAATVTSTIAGSDWNLTPTIASVSPAAIPAGSAATTITVTGKNLGNGTILLDGVALPTTPVPNEYSLALTAVVPKASLASFGWGAITVTTPAPGGGTSNPLPLTIFKALKLAATGIAFDSYSGDILASVGPSATVTKGRSIVSIDPTTGAILTNTPVAADPESLSITADGEFLYANLYQNQVVRYNMLTHQVLATFKIPTQSTYIGGVQLRGIAAQPGADNTFVVDLGETTGLAVFDVDPAKETATIRGQNSGPYSGQCIYFLDADHLLALESYGSPYMAYRYQITNAGFVDDGNNPITNSYFGADLGCSQSSGGLVYGSVGAVLNFSGAAVPDVAQINSPITDQFQQPNVVPDASLQQAYYFGLSLEGTSTPTLASFSTHDYLPVSTLPVDLTPFEGVNPQFSVNNILRWGQDGLAVLSSSGYLYLLRGPAVVPQLLGKSSAAVLTSSSVAKLAVGSGNTLITLTGRNFLPGVAVTWNGSYRTTTIVSPTQVTVALPASDLSKATTGSLVATNPGAAASAALDLPVQ
jgi:hypothetical protein